MTGHEDLDRQMSDWFHGAATTRPPDALLEATLVDVAVTGQRPGWLVRDRGRAPGSTRGRRLGVASLSLAVLGVMTLVATVGFAVLVGSTNPNPIESFPVGSPSASPSEPPPSAAGILGGGAVLVFGLNEGVAATSLALLDAGTLQVSVLGDLPETHFDTAIELVADAKRMLITRFEGTTLIEQLEQVTPAGSEFELACCAPSGQLRSWALSPDGTRLAGLETDELNGRGVAIVVASADGGNARRAPLPNDATVFGPVAWAPDSNAVAVAGCRPCDQSEDPGRPTAIQHSKVFVVPLDGAPIRELVDRTDATVGSPSWSPDGSTIAVDVGYCPAGTAPPNCADGPTAVALVDLDDGAMVDVASRDSEGGPGPATWSPDGSRLAFSDGRRLLIAPLDGSAPITLTTNDSDPVGRPSWSPDGRWLLYGTRTADQSLRDYDLWIVPVEGGEPTSIGTARGWTW